MDEFEKNVPGEEGSVLPEGHDDGPAENSADSQALQEELENIRSVFQQKLNKAAAEAEGEPEEADAEDAGSVEVEESEAPDEGEEADVEPEDGEENAEENEDDGEIPPEMLCECCGKRRRDTSFGEDYPYCGECREMMKANPFNTLGIVIALLVVAVIGVCWGLFLPQVKTMDSLMVADFDYIDGKVVDAMTGYQTYLQSLRSGDSVSLRAVSNAADILSRLGYYGDCKTVLETYVKDGKGPASLKKQYDKAAEMYDKLQTVSTMINENFSQYFEGEDIDYEEAMDAHEKYVKKHEKDEDFDAFFMEYVRYVIMARSQQSDEEILGVLLNMERLDTSGSYPWLYLNPILHYYAHTGNKEKAEEYFEKALNINRQEMQVYVDYADYFRFCDEPDAEKMLDVAREAAEIMPKDGSTPFYRTYAIAYLLKGEYDKAMENMSSYMQSNQANLSDYNLYALCCLASDDNDTYNDIKTNMNMYNVELSPMLNKYEKGKLIIKDILTDKGGEF